MTAATFDSRMDEICSARERDGAIGLKANLYTDLDVEALDAAAQLLTDGPVRLECVMVGDSILTTHHGRATTRARNDNDQRWITEVMTASVSEVASALRTAASLPGIFLMADLPDGSGGSTEVLVRTAEGFRNVGADCVKIEVDGPDALDGVQVLAGRGIPVFAHLGFTPQTAPLRRYGRTADERQQLYATARRVRDSGACGVILEMVDTTTNRALSRPSPQGLPCYSIFCGPPAVGGGLSVNAWDAVFRHPSGSRGFPSSAFLGPSEYPEQYTVGNVTRGLADLFALVTSGRFPESITTTKPTSEEQDDPWQR